MDMTALAMKGHRVEVTRRPVRAPGKGEVQVRVMACGANASDWEFITGRPFYGRLARFFMRIKVPGSDVAGVVETVGEGVTLKPGDRVVADTFEKFGGFAQYCTTPARLWVPIPDDLSFVDAAALPQSGAIALTALDEIGDGTKVLVNGAGGGAGPYFVALAKAKGCEVWAVDNAGKASAMQAADHVYDYQQTDFADLGERWDYILDLWATRSMKRIDACLTEGGRYKLVGAPMNVLIAAAFKKRLLMVQQGPVMTKRMVELVTAKKVTPNIGEVAKLEDGPQALARMGAGKIAGKLILTP